MKVKLPLLEDHVIITWKPKGIKQYKKSFVSFLRITRGCKN